MKRKKRTRWVVWSVIILTVAASAYIFCSGGNKEEEGRKTVEVERKTIVDKALAVGAIEPVDEIAVKSKVSGVVGKLYVEEGDFVEKGSIVLDVRPDPTPLELARAKRNVEMAEIEKKQFFKELERKKQMQEKGLMSDQEYEEVKQRYDQAALQYQINKEQLDLIEKGKVRIGNNDIETVVKAPITGFVLERLVNQGDPVVPLTSYQAGTPLLSMANMANLVCKGTVDEIDVGKISEGMPCQLKIGALPGQQVDGHVKLISLKAEKKDNTTVFPVEIAIDDTHGAQLRAGFSANADIIIAQKDSVLSVPERVVTFENDSAYVMIPKGQEDSEKLFIETGLSDAIQIEVTSGLEEGQKVLEKEPKEII